MRLTILILTVLLSAASLSAQSKTLDSLTHHKNLKPGDVHLKVPGWMIRTGLKMVAKHDNQATRTMRSLRRSLKKAEIMVLDNLALSSQTMGKILSEFKEDGFEDYVQVRDGEQYVNVMVKEKREKIRNLVITVSDGSEQFVAVNLKTKISHDELEKLINESDF